jgi:hypothetical protein
MFKKEWLPEITETEILSSEQTKDKDRRHIYSLRNQCHMQYFTSGIKWNKWKLDYLKQNLQQKVQVDSIIKS